MSERTFTTTGDFDVEDYLDLEECHRTPIHRTAKLQPHGTFVQIAPEDGTIVAAADNAGEYFNDSPGALIGRPLSEAVSTSTARRLAPVLEREPSSRRELVLDEGAQRVLLTAFPTGDTLGLEVESVVDTGASAERALSEADRLLDRIRRADSDRGLYYNAVDAVREATDLDRVMLYKFDHQGNGQVVAETKRDDLESYLDHHFPSSDIPEPARRLYRINPLRYIPDVDYEAVSILGPDGPLPFAEMDLTHSALRSVPRVHREYLRNMGVGASLSIPLTVDGRLWGLIACHGTEDHHLSVRSRSICKLIGRTVAEEIEHFKHRRREQTLREAEGFHADMEGRYDSYQTLFDHLQDHREELLSMVQANAFYVRILGRECWVGPMDVIDDADALLEGIPTLLRAEDVISVESIADSFDAPWDGDPNVSGFMAARLGRMPQSYCVWFRPEYRQELVWGGDPRNPVSRDDAKQLSPRSSFEAWTQIVEHKARRWSELDELAAREMVQTLNAIAFEVQYHEARKINDRLEELNRKNEQLLAEAEKLARTDTLTGLFNRRELMNRLEEETGRAKRYEGDLALGILDLDHFKDVNDRWGHQVGDEVLAAMGDILEHQTRASDIPGRYGGEEFAIVFPETTAEEAATVAERIRRTLGERSFTADGTEFRVTCSLGLAEWSDTDRDADDLLERADEALYRAKENGRDRVELEQRT